MSAIKHVVITAAGIGSRLGMNIPKCLVPVANKCIIDYQLALLEDIEDVRIVVGFMREEVILHVKKIRPDAIFVCNHQYATTTTLQSLFLGVKRLKEAVLIIDGDVIPEAVSFKNFLQYCKHHTAPLTTICRAATSDAVYAVADPTDDQNILNIMQFRRHPATPFEWPGISFIQPETIKNEKTFIYQRLEHQLPLPAYIIKCWEVDTPEDLLRVNREANDD
ncbi:MAG: hypothetical protein A2X78_03020 [Gammaproteobacteria bacterium GWE2_37_16]|nr:MAG: hypothetical protein A2X78_03020 [Gammaproteobacteria bacterium GWE2_37_16]